MDGKVLNEKTAPEQVVTSTGKFVLALALKFF
jgi:hypothetical protein